MMLLNVLPQDFRYRPTDVGPDRRRASKRYRQNRRGHAVQDYLCFGRHTAAPSVMAPKRSKSPSDYRKPCSICDNPRDVLVRCRIDETLQWNFVCPGSCWRVVSGGVIDGSEDKPHYAYGGMWKNKHAFISAKSKNRNKNNHSALMKVWSDCQADYIQNDRVRHEGKVWICRRSHSSDNENAPGLSYRYWKEAPSSASDDQPSGGIDTDQIK